MSNINDNVLQIIDIYYNDLVDEYSLSEIIHILYSNILKYNLSSSWSHDNVINHILYYFNNEHFELYDNVKNILFSISNIDISRNNIDLSTNNTTVSDNLYLSMNFSNVDSSINNTLDLIQSTIPRIIPVNLDTGIYDDLYFENDANYDDYESNDNLLNIIERVSNSIEVNGTRRMIRINLTNASNYISRYQNNIRDTIVDRFTDNLSDVKLTIKKTELRKIKKMNYSRLPEKIINAQPQCTICQDDFKKDDLIKITKCEHIFHSKCIDKWFGEYSYKCPICREKCGDYEANI